MSGDIRWCKRDVLFGRIDTDRVRLVTIKDSTAPLPRSVLPKAIQDLSSPDQVCR
jgi:hypothetical protein